MLRTMFRRGCAVMRASGMAAAPANRRASTTPHPPRRRALAVVAPPGVPLPPAPAPTSLGAMFGLAGKTVMVTGAGGALGRETCRGLAAAGAGRVIAVDADAGRLKDLATSLQHDFPHVVLDGVAADAADREALARGLPPVDTIHTLVTLAGALGPVKPPEDVTDDDWQAAIRANATTVLVAAATARPRMPRGGSIVVVGSIASFVGYGTQAPYAAAKGALGPLVRSLALAWAPAGIRANLVLPGPADTPFTRTVLSSKARVAATVAALPAFRLGAASDFIAPILFFASDGAAFCTGASLVVDGGGTARGMAPA